MNVEKLLSSIKEKKQKVLVTGGSGYVGSQLLEQLEKHKIEYVSVDKKHKKNKNLDFDLRDKKKTVERIEKFSPDYLVHCATYSAIAYRDNFHESFKEDSIVINNILETLSKFPSCRLVYFSSSYVYSNQDKRKKVNEEVALKPTHNFGVAKLFFEQLILKNHKNSVIFRLSSVFGPGNALHPNAILNMAKECIENGKLEVWGSGSRMMHYIFMKDVIDYICEAFIMEPGIYNLGGEEYISVADTAKLIADFFSSKAVFLKDKKEGQTLPFMDTSKIKNASANHITPFKKALNEYLELIKEDKKPLVQ